MPALIPELIAMASDPTVKATDLLRKAMVAARLLKQYEWATWISHELQGYPDGVDLPAYRLLRGELKAWNPVRGLIPLHTDSPEMTDLLSTCRCGKSLGELEELSAPGQKVRYIFPPELAATLMSMQNMPMKPEVSVASSQVRGLIEEVRNQVLTWALDLNDVGIQGEGMSFTPKEQQQAKLLGTVTNIHIHGGVHGSQVMVSSPHGQQQTVTGELRTEALAALLPWLQRLINSGQLQQEVCDELQADLDTLKAQAASPKPKWPVIGAVASSVRTILEGTGGGVLAGLALGWLTALTAG